MNTIKHLTRTIETRMEADGTMARIDAKQAQHAAYASSLGYDSAQQAYKALGKGFIEMANLYKPVTQQVQQGVAGFVSLVSKGWEADLAFECSYDGVYDLVGKEAFLNMCQQAAKEKANERLN